ncbi:GNAT family N-acetyltransferase [Micromonospora sp. DT4]|uniref:GNAT family N-acetyltransferase n=1 Tax=Micromonospora sp. DT4 TaxID=3393438 RepID=UPI003CF029FA
MSTNSIHDLEPQLAANRRFWCGWAGAEPDADLAIYRSEIPHPLFNGVLRVRTQSLDAAVAEAKERLAGTTWSWWVGGDSDEDTAEGLLARGAQQIIDMPVMAIDVRAVADAEVPADLKIVEVVGPDEMVGYVGAYAEPLGFGGDVHAQAQRELAFDYPDVVRLAGVVDGRTVGTCTLSLGTEVGALYCIATHAGFRHRGVATALTREALRITRETGRSVVTLQATSEGEPVYRKIGFEEVSRYRLYQFPA